MTGLALALQGGLAPESFARQDFHGVTTLHPLGLMAILVLGVTLIFVPRRYAAIPFLLLACLVPASQRLVIATLDFNLLRLLVLAGWARIFLHGEYRGLRWCRLDSLVVAWSLVSAVSYVVLHGTFGSAIYRAGMLYDALGLYLFFRCVLRGWRDLELMVRWVAITAVPVAFVFAVEKTTGRNMFAFLGGVPEFTVVREGRLRVQGPFPHAILAGCFFAVWFPLVVSLAWRPGQRVLSVVGTLAIFAIIVMCASSTPVGGVFVAIVGLCAWLIRDQMRPVRWTVAITLVVLHLIMRQPVWHLISRMSFSPGSTSYHRFLLIDNAIRHVGEWALIGTKDTSHWGHSMYDLTNQFVAEAARGGLLALVLFVASLACAFSYVGRLWRIPGVVRDRRLLVWGLGVSLLVHVAIFLGISISYSQQALMAFYFVLAAIGSLASRGLDVAPAAERAARKPRLTTRRSVAGGA